MRPSIQRTPAAETDLQPHTPRTRQSHPQPQAVGRTFEYTFPLPERSNAGGCPPTKEEKSRKKNRKTTPSRHPKKATPKRHPEPDRAEVEAKRQEQPEHNPGKGKTAAARENTRLYAQEQRRKAREQGLCRDCREPAIPEQSRCSTCAEKHRAGRQHWYAEQRTKGKRRE